MVTLKSAVVGFVCSDRNGRLAYKQREGVQILGLVAHFIAVVSTRETINQKSTVRSMLAT